MSRENQGQPTDDLRERLIRTAYLDIALEEVLTIKMERDGLPWVPGHWRQEAEARARAALSGTTTEWGVRWPDGSVSTLDDDLDAFSEASAREYVADGCATLVSRQVTEWREVEA